MKSYEVSLIRRVEQEQEATIAIEAKDEDEARRKALRYAETNDLDWSSPITAPEYSDVTVTSIEEVLDLEEEL